MSKGLEALINLEEEIIDCLPNSQGTIVHVDSLLETIKKELKALDFIKQYCIVADYKTDDPDTRYELAFCHKVRLTQEDYDLLKEVLL